MLKNTWSRFQSWFQNLDPRIPVAAILFTYLVLGLTTLGFNRSPLQAITTTCSCLMFEVLLCRIFNKKWVLPLSALITSFSLSFLLNYSHDFYLLFIPIFFSIGSKYIFTFNGRHALNPAMMGVSLSLLLSQELVTAAPAYQWNGIAAMSLFIVTLGLVFVIPKVNRHWLVISFLITFSLQTALRAWIMKHHLPFETLFLGTLSSPSFYIFTFFMITDPATSPKDKKQQIIVGISLALVDLLLHLRQSYYTFFYAALIVGSTRLVWNHIKVIRAQGAQKYFTEKFIVGRYYLRPALLLMIALFGVGAYTKVIHPRLEINNLDWHFNAISADKLGLNSYEKGDLLEIVDPRVAHVAKWILSNGESVATADIDNDGKLDLFLTNLLKKPEDRATLYRNRGDRYFEKVNVPFLNEIRMKPKEMGIVTNAIFVDYDNDGDQDLFLVVAFGRSRLLKNMLKETGRLEFVDVTDQVGLGEYTNAIGATFADLNKDGLLDLMILNVWPSNLPDYKTPHLLNIFDLPASEYAGDERMFNFMHDSWHLSNNGGENFVYYQTPDHHFQRQDSKLIGMPETRWSLAVGVADLNHDQWPDIYIANDFGPDDLYYNHEGKKFENIKGTIFGSIGRDTYKGMNVSIADFDNTSWLGVYVSNVHHSFQAEGSLLWTFTPSAPVASSAAPVGAAAGSVESGFYPSITESATQKAVLNENRFGWGAAAADLDNDGFVDLAQANGMVDDTFDKKFESCPDYWYVNEKIARSPPSIHRYANKWGDLRGYCIYGKEQNRIYINRGVEAKPQFIDVAEHVGVTHLGSSRGVIAADFDNQGRMDLLFTYPFEAPQFYQNVYTGPEDRKPQWLGLNLISKNPKCNRDAIGTKADIEVQYEDGSTKHLRQEVQVVSGFSSQGDRRLHFGLGIRPKSVSVKVDWCYGVKTEAYNQLMLNSYNTLTLD